MKKLDAYERNVMISTLEWRTKFAYEYLKSLDDEKLIKLYKERAND